MLLGALTTAVAPFLILEMPYLALALVASYALSTLFHAALPTLPILFIAALPNFDPVDFSQPPSLEALLLAVLPAQLRSVMIGWVLDLVSALASVWAKAWLLPLARVYSWFCTAPAVSVSTNWAGSSFESDWAKSPSSSSC